MTEEKYFTRNRNMLQVPNIIKNPLIWIPPTVASGLVGQFATIDAMGMSSIPLIILLHFIAPAVITLIVAEYMRKKNWIKFGDMKLDL